MSVLVIVTIGIASSLALVSLGGGLYEFLVVDPSWPSRPDIIQPNRGGVSRKRFWIPAHTAFELASWARHGLVDAGGSLLAPPCSREPRSHAHLVFCRLHTEGTLIRTRQA